MQPKSSPHLRIGMFDSGVGGLSVLQHVQKTLPNSSFVYFGDTARFPYGGKSPETISRYALENTIFLLEHNIDLLLIACNTATCHSLSRLQKTFSIPIFGIIQPAIEHVIKTTQNKRIGIIGTKATIQSQIYQKTIAERLDGAHITACACPLFVSLVEEQIASRQIIELVVKEYLAEITKAKIDTLLLACTHYPLLYDAIRKEVGDDIQIVNPAQMLAEATKNHIEKSHPQQKDALVSDREVAFFVSDDPDRFLSIGEKFLGTKITNIQLVHPKIL